MSNEKMRDQFEAWVKANWPNQSLDRFNPLHGVTEGEYMGFTVQHCWDAWQASRAAIEVEFPKTVGFEGAYDSVRSHEFYPSMEDVEDADEIYGLCRAIEVRETLESLGLKVKP